MSKKATFLGKAVFIRHGHTEYTGKFPDLTNDGKLAIKNSAIRIHRLWRQFPGSYLYINSSCAPRAMGSAFIIAGVLDFSVAKIEERELLRPAKVVDRVRGQAIYNEYMARGGMRALSIAYNRDPRYADPAIIEPRDEVRDRFYLYFDELIKTMAKSQHPMFSVNVSHYETLCHMAENVFKLDYNNGCDPLGFGEWFTVELSRLENGKLYLAFGFRDKSAEMACNIN